MWETVLATGAVALAVLIVTRLWEDWRQERSRKRIIRDAPLNTVQTVIDLGTDLLVDIQVAKSPEDFVNITLKTPELLRALQRATISVQAADNKDLALGLQKFVAYQSVALQNTLTAAFAAAEHEAKKKILDKLVPTLQGALAKLQRLYQVTISI